MSNKQNFNYNYWYCCVVISRTFRSIWIVGDFNLCSIPPEDHVILLPIISHSLHLSFSLKRTVKLKTYNRLRKMAKVRVLYWSTPRFTYPDCVFRHQYSHTNPKNSFQLIVIEPALVSHKYKDTLMNQSKFPQKIHAAGTNRGKTCPSRPRLVLGFSLLLTGW